VPLRRYRRFICPSAVKLMKTLWAIELILTTARRVVGAERNAPVEYFLIHQSLSLFHSLLQQLRVQFVKTRWYVGDGLGKLRELLALASALHDALKFAPGRASHCRTQPWQEFPRENRAPLVLVLSRFNTRPNRTRYDSESNREKISDYRNHSVSQSSRSHSRCSCSRKYSAWVR
jgi:hypothetical protein